MMEHSHDAAMYTTAAISLATIAVVFTLILFLGKRFKQDIPLAINLFVSSAAGAAVVGFGIPLRQLFEGPVWYIYINLVILTGMIFLTVMKHSGNLDCITWDILTKFRNHPVVLFILLTVMVYFPGMFTGVGTAAVLSTGVFAAAILRIVGVPRAQNGAIIAMLSTLGAAAPPVNIPALIIASGINMPYEGFDAILWALTIPLGLFSIFFIGYRYFKAPTMAQIEAEMPWPERKNFVMPYVPLIVVVAIFILIRIFPGKFPDIITPMVFMVGSIVGLFTGKKLNYVKASKEAVQGGVFNTVALLFVVGTVVQITTLTGAKGLVVLGALTLGAVAPVVMYAALGISLPLIGGVLTHLGASVILGIPFTLALLTQNVIVVVAAISILCVLAQIIPPSAVGGYFAQGVVQEPKYGAILKHCAIPTVVSIVVAIVALVFANQLANILVPF